MVNPQYENGSTRFPALIALVGVNIIVSVCGIGTMTKGCVFFWMASVFFTIIFFYSHFKKDKKRSSQHILGVHVTERVLGMWTSERTLHVGEISGWK